MELEWTAEDEALKAKVDAKIEELRDILEDTDFDMMVNFHYKQQGWGAQMFKSDEKAMPARMVLAAELLRDGEQAFFARLFPNMKAKFVVVSQEEMADIEAKAKAATKSKIPGGVN